MAREKPGGGWIPSPLAEIELSFVKNAVFLLGHPVELKQEKTQFLLDLEEKIF